MRGNFLNSKVLGPQFVTHWCKLLRRTEVTITSWYCSPS